ncbi:GAF domain-containing protein [Massilia sp. G4R7]|uniref:GAF domain-containing protein n=1 Tax=Massilia phyllostachyos TaxID=2898585 RepID=A0ABS8Q970_9BURK|nr:GAF domain-containing protein [Massilia phyllostachyos]MCD2517145.1 GAF domain-containing protein [Massilia phyllostachyos]
MSALAWETDPGRRGEFFRQLQQLTTQIHATRNVDDIMLDVSSGICSLFGADRLSIYVVGEDKASLVSKVKTGLSSFRQLRLPISALSVAGYAALSRRTVNLHDVYDEAELQRYAPELRFQQGVDRRTGYRTREMLVIPILHEDTVIGVFQLINNLLGGAFSATVVEGASSLCETLAVAFAQRRQEEVRGRGGFADAIRESALPRGQVEQALQHARASGQDIEDVLIDDFRLKLPVVGRALADHFAVPYLSHHPQRRVPADLIATLDRAAAARQQWLPVARNDNGVYVACVDPEQARLGGAVVGLFPDARPVYCVTTRRDFAAMLDHYYGPESMPAPASIGAQQQSQLLGAVASLVAGSHAQGLSDLRIETAPGERPGEIRFTVSGVMRLP